MELEQFLPGSKFFEVAIRLNPTTQKENRTAPSEIGNQYQGAARRW
jgi:hypothetical protein